MINVAVYGDMKYSHQMKMLLQNEYSDLLRQGNGEEIVVSYLVAEGHQEDGIISLSQFASKYASKELAAIVIPKEYYMQYNSLIQKLIKHGINLNDIYNGKRLTSIIGFNMDKSSMVEGYDQGQLGDLITPMLSDSYLSYLEYHVADHCNMNCKYCTHYSPLVKEPVFTDFDKWKQDMDALKTKIDDIGIIRILGGEPLLNPDLPAFIEYTRKLYPAAVITVVTNGILVRQISQELIDTMNRNIAFFHISYYPPLEPTIEEVKKFLVEKNIAFTMSPKMDKFMKTTTLKPNGNEDFFYSCFEATCNCIFEGKIAACYAPYTTKFFNKEFDKSLPEDEGIDLYNSENTTENIKLKLLYPMKRCDYCINGGEQDWERVTGPTTLSDWV